MKSKDNVARCSNHYNLERWSFAEPCTSKINGSSRKALRRTLIDMAMSASDGIDQAARVGGPVYLLSGGGGASWAVQTVRTQEPYPAPNPTSHCTSNTPDDDQVERASGALDQRGAQWGAAPSSSPGMSRPSTGTDE